MARTGIARRLTFTAVLLLGFGALAEKQSNLPQYIGIPSNLMNQYFTNQRSMQWCWAACIQMVFSRFGLSVQQEAIVRRTYGTDPQGKLPDKPGDALSVTLNLNNWGIDAAGKKYTVKARYGAGAPPCEAILGELAAGYPVILGFNTGLIGHAVVCTGASYILAEKTDPNGQARTVPVIQNIVVRDPFPRPFPPNVVVPGAQGRLEYRADEIAKFILHHWFIRVQVEGQQEQSVNSQGPSQLIGVPKQADLLLPKDDKGFVLGDMPAEARPAQEAKDGGVEITRSDIRWIEGPEQPYATFSLAYTNASQEPKACQVTVEVELASRKTEQPVRTFQTQKFAFELQPGQSHAVEGKLEAFQDLEVHPRLNARLTAAPK